MYYGQGNLDEFLYKNYFLNVKNGFFVECGAADGCTESSCKFFEESLAWTGINIEPVPTSYKLLIKNRPKSRNLNVALSNYKKNITFIDKTPKKQKILTGWGYIDDGRPMNNTDLEYIKYEIECVKFSDIFIENRVIDLFVLDVEGHELEAIKGILEINKEYYPRIFCIEVDKANVEEISSMLNDYYIQDKKTPNDRIYKRKY